MPEPDQHETGAGLLGGRSAVVYWLAAAALYIALGIAAPPVFLLGFQESLVYVFLVTVLAPVVLRRRRG